MVLILPIALGVYSYQTH